MDIVTVLAVGVISTCVFFLVLRRRQRDGRKPVPGPQAWPILGNARQIGKRKMHMTLYEWMNAYGDIFQFVLLGRNYVVLNCSELFESVVSQIPVRPLTVMGSMNHDNSGPTFSNDTFHLQELKQGIINVVNDKTVIDISDEEIHELINILKESTGSDVAVDKVVNKTVTSQWLVALIGCKPTSADIAAVWEFMEASETLFATSASALISTFPWLKYIPGTQYQRLYNWNKNAMEIMIRELTRNDRDTETYDRHRGCHGLIAQLNRRKGELESRGDETETITDKTIHGMLVDCCFGLPPWIVTIVSGILCIAKNSAVQEKLHAELDKVCQDKPPTLANREKLPYVIASILEIHRYISNHTTTIPYQATEDTEINGYFVTKNTLILGGLFNIHHSEAIWNDPWTFRPERFIDESGMLLYSKHVIPFSTGPRMCKGYSLAEPSIFTCLSNILYHFDILPPTNGELPDHDPRTFKYAAILKVPLFSCRFKPRVSKEVH